MSGIDLLESEHDVISVGLDVLAAVCERLSSKEPVEPGHLHDLVRFFQLYADRLHHAKEEDAFELLYGRDPQLDRMMGSLCTQHVMAREFVSGMQEASEKIARGQARAVKRFCEEADAYRTLLRIHICDENHVLFPLMRKHLRGTQLAKVTRKFKATDAQLMAEPGTKRCIQSVKKLQKLYHAEPFACLPGCR